MKRPPTDPCAPVVRAADVPVVNGGEPNPLGTADVPPAINGGDPNPLNDSANGSFEAASDIDTRKVPVTIFKDEFASSLRCVELSLPQLAEHIRYQTAASKGDLPLLKLAIFGSKRSDKNCLRTNENTEQIAGVEGEHDAGEISFDTAIAVMRKVGIRCIIYTSPSYVPVTKERWRILVPLSQKLSPDAREKFVARVNGLFDGKLALESFVLSQAFYYGSVNNNPNHRVEVIDGKHLDKEDRTYAGSIFKDGSRVGDHGAGIDLNGAGRQDRSRKDDDPEPVDRDRIEAALNVISSDCNYKTVWMPIGGALYYALGDSGFELFDRWSAKASARYNANECRESWRGLRSLREYTPATIFHFADQADPDWRDRYDWSRSTFSGAGASNGAGSANAGPGVGSGGAGTSGSTGTGPGTGTGTGTGSAGATPPNPPLISATSYVWINPADIPKRNWLYGRLLIRKFVTATVAPGGLGKSSLIIAEALSQVSGKEILGVTPKGRLRVWLWNLEDPQEETQRKIQAAAKHYSLKAEDIGNRFFVDSGRDRPLVIATMTRNGPAIVRPVVDALVAEIIDKQIDVLIVDPFVSCQELPENDNTAQDMVIKEWGRIADHGNCAVHLVDHTRKMGSLESEVTAESSRGAKAKTDAARVVRVVNRMTKDEAERTGVQNHGLHFRTYNDKANLAPPADKSDWFELKSVDLGNGPGMEVGGVKFNGPGDSVGVVQVWQWPDPLTGMTGADFDKVAAVIKRGKWRENVQAKAWVGHAVAQALGLDVGNKAHRTKIIGVLKAWLAAGSLIVVEGPDENRETKKFIEVREEDA